MLQSHRLKRTHAVYGISPRGPPSGKVIPKPRPPRPPPKPHVSLQPPAAAGAAAAAAAVAEPAASAEVAAATAGAMVLVAGSESKGTGAAEAALDLEPGQEAKLREVFGRVGECVPNLQWCPPLATMAAIPPALPDPSRCLRS